MEVPVIYENDAILVIDKPAGVVVNRAHTVRGGTIQDWVEHKFSINPASPAGRNFQFSDKDSEFKARSGIVHRLDKETSGVLLIAKTEASFASLTDQFKNRTVKKTYRAIVHGKLPSDGEVRAPIARLPWNRMRFGVVPGGRESITRFHALSYHLVGEGIGEVTLAEVSPETGRTHQIRVHFKYLNHPVLGDALYGGRKTSIRDRRVVTRLMLHAHRLEFTHPQSGERLVFEAPIPDDMKRILAQ